MRGACRSRTGVRGFAGPCLTTRPTRPGLYEISPDWLSTDSCLLQAFPLRTRSLPPRTAVSCVRSDRYGSDVAPAYGSRRQPPRSCAKTHRSCELPESRARASHERQPLSRLLALPSGVPSWSLDAVGLEVGAFSVGEGDPDSLVPGAFVDDFGALNLGSDRIAAGATEDRSGEGLGGHLASLCCDLHNPMLAHLVPCVKRQVVKICSNAAEKSLSGEVTR